MTIELKRSGEELLVYLAGRLDTDAQGQLETTLRQNLPGVKLLIFDLTALEYLSSAGLRLLLAAQKLMNRQGQMIVRNINATVSEIFEITGFSDLLTIQ